MKKKTDLETKPCNCRSTDRDCKGVLTKAAKGGVVHVRSPNEGELLKLHIPRYLRWLFVFEDDYHRAPVDWLLTFLVWSATLWAATKIIDSAVF
jgi:hypothetical protein